MANAKLGHLRGSDGSGCTLMRRKLLIYKHLRCKQRHRIIAGACRLRDARVATGRYCVASPLLFSSANVAFVRRIAARQSRGLRPSARELR